jgi:hypothetical protein
MAPSQFSRAQRTAKPEANLLVRAFAEVLLGWVMIAIAAIWARLTARWWGKMDAEIAHIESAAQQQR